MLAKVGAHKSQNTDRLKTNGRFDQLKGNFEYVNSQQYKSKRSEVHTPTVIENWDAKCAIKYFELLSIGTSSHFLPHDINE